MARIAVIAKAMTELIRRDVLVEPEEVVGVVLPLQRLQAVVLPPAVGLADSLLPSSIRKFT
jgi:hypothetical protein